MRKITAIFVSLLALVLAGCSQQTTAAPSGATVTVTSKGGSVDVPVNPQRVVALDSTSMETLHAMGIKPVAVPKALLPASLADWKNDASITDVGTHREPKLEAINAAEPDLIVGGKRFVSYTETLQKIAPVIDIAPVVEEPDYAAQLKTQTTQLGEIFGKQDIATALNADLDKAIADAAGKTTGQSVFLANHNGGKIDNGAGRLAPLVEPLNLRNVFDGVAGGSDSVHSDSGLAPETVAQANPDWMIVLDRDAVVSTTAVEPVEQTIASQSLWAESTFVKQGQIVVLPADFYLTESIQAYTTAYKQLAEDFAK